jgi:hypothetical protein
MSTLSVAQTPYRKIAAHRLARGRWGAGLALLISLTLVLQQGAGAARPADALGPHSASLYDMMQQSQGEAALSLVAEHAAQFGGWGPAPGDRLVYDATLAISTRAAVIAVDTTPAECAMQKPGMQSDHCRRDFKIAQNLVRFGPTAFANKDEAGNLVPRPELDDLLSTYIEEVGHSWQEYLFETEGRGEGERTRVTSWEDGLYWSHGWEYQVKMYVLSLDGGLLHLSDQERTVLTSSICRADGYANPIGRHVPPFAAPAGWPHPEGWPVAVPTPEAFQTFCGGL